MSVILVVLLFVYFKPELNPFLERPATVPDSLNAPHTTIIGRTPPEEQKVLIEIKEVANAMADAPHTTIIGRGLAANAVGTFEKGDYRKAIELFKELSIKDKGALLGIGVSYYRLGDYDNAIRYLEESLRHEDGFIQRKLLAYIYYNKNDLERSLLSAEKGLSIKNDPELYSLYEKLEGEAKTQVSYVEEGSFHFRLFFDGRQHAETGRKVNAMLEEAYSSIGGRLFYFPIEPVIVILYTEKDFFDLTKGPEWSMGAYDGKIRLPVRGLDRGGEELLKKTLFHEYTHALVHQMTRNCPVWINEGLAEYFSGGREKIGQVIPLKLLEGSFLDMSKDRVNIAYKESYSAVLYLIERYGILSVKQLLLYLGEGKGLNQAFRDVCAISYDEFVLSWGLT